jgi:beta-galactosidase
VRIHVASIKMASLSNSMNSAAAISRREFLRNCAATATLTTLPILGAWDSANGQASRGPAARTFSLDTGWLFGGTLDASDPHALDPAFDDSSFPRVTLPHCVTPLSWQNWDPSTWQHVWLYRRHFKIPDEPAPHRIFLSFDRVMAAATLTLNGQALDPHQGGYLPFQREITAIVKQNNLLAVEVDSRFLSIPPAGNPKGPTSVDYLLPGGITGSVHLRVLPQVFISDVFAKPIDVLGPNRQLEITCTIDAGARLPGNLRLSATLSSGTAKIAETSSNLVEQPGQSEHTLTLNRLGNVALWDVVAPHLYDLQLTLLHNDQPIHNYRTRVGFREARFDVDGFFLNGRRLQLFGLNRHELYPYVGYAMPGRVQRRDAEILRHDFNCNIVRCSHYPQSPAFLDACDELGLMVWEETPGWGYIGDEHWEDMVVENVRDMVRRDRNRPSIVIWGVRVNESRNDQPLYRRTTALAKSLDGTRPTSGSMTNFRNWQQEWHQDVFAMDDYHSAPDGTVGIYPPLPGVPYMLSETVGQYSYGAKGFNNKYRRAGDLALQTQQALLHAQAHDRAAAYPRCAGVIAWCAFDYASLMNDYAGVKCPGVADTFRIPKLGASFYRSQVDPRDKPVIEPNFHWDFGAASPNGPGSHASIFSNCDRLELQINGRPHAIVHPDRTAFPHLKYPPSFADLELDGSTHPELRIDGYLGDRLVLSRPFSSDPSADRLSLKLDDAELTGDGSDATRLSFAVTDKFGAPRPFVQGQIHFRIEDPGVIVGDNPFQLEDSGGAGAVWIKAAPGATGHLAIEVTHTSLGSHKLSIQLRPASTGSIATSTRICAVT